MTLNTPGCVNRGYVLDCFPENHKQANNVFKKMYPVDEEGNPPEEEDIEDDLDTYDIPEPVEGEEPPEEEPEEDEEPEEEEEEEEEGAFVPPDGKVPTPDYVLVLDASDEELADRVKVMPITWLGPQFCIPKQNDNMAGCTPSRRQWQRQTLFRHTVRMARRVSKLRLLHGVPWTQPSPMP